VVVEKKTIVDGRIMVETTHLLQSQIIANDQTMLGIKDLFDDLCKNSGSCILS